MITIKIDDNYGVELKTTRGLSETVIATTLVVETLRNMNPPTSNDQYKLLLTGYGPYPADKLNAVKAIKEILDLELKEAKKLVDECNGCKPVVIANGKKEDLENIAKKFDNRIGVNVEVSN